MEKKIGTSIKQKRELRQYLHNKKGGDCCHYCGIREEDFLNIWGKFYGLPYRGTCLEIDRKGNNLTEHNTEYTPENCVLACALCNMSKSDKFTEEEFKKVGQVIREIWQARKAKIVEAGIKNRASKRDEVPL